MQRVLVRGGYGAGGLHGGWRALWRPVVSGPQPFQQRGPLPPQSPTRSTSRSSNRANVAAVHAALNRLFEDGRQQTGSNNMPRAASRGSRVRVEGSPWQGTKDALAADVKKFSDPVAMEAMQAAGTAADLVAAVADALCAIGKTSVGVVFIEPRVAGLMEGLGDFVRKAVKPTESAGASILKAHDEDIRRIQENDPKKRRWDITVHDGKPGSGIRRQRRYGARTG
jgi:hypothetical protein